MNSCAENQENTKRKSAESNAESADASHQTKIPKRSKSKTAATGCIVAIIFENKSKLEIRTEIKHSKDEATAFAELFNKFNSGGKCYVMEFSSKDEHDVFIEKQKNSLFEQNLSEIEEKEIVANTAIQNPFIGPNKSTNENETDDQMENFMNSVPDIIDNSPQSFNTSNRESLTTSPFVKLVAKASENTGDHLKIHVFPMHAKAIAGLVAWEFLNNAENNTIGWGHKPGNWTAVFRCDSQMKQKRLLKFFHQCGDYPKRESGSDKVAYSPQSRSGFRAVLSVNYGFFSPSLQDNTNLSQFIAKALEKMSHDPEIQAAYRESVLASVRLETRKIMEVDFDPSKGDRYWKRFRSSINNSVTVYHNSLNEVFLDEHVCNLVSRIIPHVSETDVKTRKAPSDILQIAFGIA